MSMISKYFSSAKNNSFWRYGLPFLIFMLGGSYALKQFTSIRYDFDYTKKTFGVTPELAKQFGAKFKGQADIDEEYRKMKETMNIDNWKNIRGPRPYEENSPEYDELIEKIKNKKSSAQ